MEGAGKMAIDQGILKRMNRTKSRKRWKEAKGPRMALLITSTLALAVCARFLLTSPSRKHCSHVKNWQGSPAFLWDSTFTDVEQASNWSTKKWLASSPIDLKLSHLLFNVAGSAQLWPRRKEYVKLWWRPNDMRGFVWLEENVKQKPDDKLPTVMVSEKIDNFTYTNPTGHPSGIRIARIIQEAFRMDVQDVCWFILGDDDTVFSPENLVRVLKKYDHRELYYIGNPSESHTSNTCFSHGMAFGGGGIAISYALAEALSTMLDPCLERYPFLFGSDDRLHACITELGVPLTREPGFHQFDMHGNPFGLLAAHPVAPFISMHHLDEVEPVFPGLNSIEGMRRLTQAMQIEPSSFLQRCVCYDRRKKLTFSVASGYSVQVYPYILLPRDLERPEITFQAWNTKDGREEFDVDTRVAVKSMCRNPFLFFLENLQIDEDGSVIALYKRDAHTDSKQRWWFCFSYMYLPKEVQRIRIVSKPLDEQWFKVPRRQCCKATQFRDQELSIVMNSCRLGKASFL